MNETTRRRFLQTAAAGGAVAGFGGFSAMSQWLGSRWLDGTEGLTSFRAPTSAEIDEATHVINRLTFGPRPGDHQRITAMGARNFIAEQLDPASIKDHEAEAQSRHFEALHAWPAGELLEYSPAELLDQLTRDKIQRALHSKRQLFEVMVDFWSDHFNIDPSKGDSRWFKPLDDRQVIRRHAMGNFSELVRASALSPAMLWYLDGRVNRKASEKERPNENYARELLELHTLGVDGGYTQTDVMEVARCLTGWTLHERKKARFAVGKVQFQAGRHDDGAKTVLGVDIPSGLGEGDLDRVIDIVSHHPSTARHLATKLCRRFISDTPPEAVVATVSKAFLDSRGDIRQVLAALFDHEAFWSARGGKLKRPFHFVVSAMRATGAETNAGPELQDYLLRMGHAPFQYPTPDGYPEEPEPWTATLLWRWRFAAEFAANGIKGTSHDAGKLLPAVGDQRAFAAHLLGRLPTEAEVSAALESGAPLALMLASPAFQMT